MVRLVNTRGRYPLQEQTSKSNIMNQFEIEMNGLKNGLFQKLSEIERDKLDALETKVYAMQKENTKYLADRRQISNLMAENQADTDEEARRSRQVVLMEDMYQTRMEHVSELQRIKADYKRQLFALDERIRDAKIEHNAAMSDCMLRYQQWRHRERRAMQ